MPNETGNNFNISKLNALLNQVNSLVINEPKKKNGAIKNVVDALEGAIKKTTTNLGESKSQVSELNARIQLLEAEMSTLKQVKERGNEEHLAAIEALKATSTESQATALSNLKRQHNESIKTLTNSKNAEKKAVQNELNALRVEKTRYNGELNERIASIEGQITALKEEKSELENVIIPLYKKNLDKATEAINKLTTKLQNYKSAYTTLQSEVNEIYKKYSNESGALTTNVNKIVEKAQTQVQGGSKKRVVRKRKITPKKKKQTKSKRKSTKRKQN